MTLPKEKKAENFAGVRGPGRWPRWGAGATPLLGDLGCNAPPAAEDFLLFEHQLEASPGSFFTI